MGRHKHEHVSVFDLLLIDYYFGRLKSTSEVGRLSVIEL